MKTFDVVKCSKRAQVHSRIDSIPSLMQTFSDSRADIIVPIPSAEVMIGYSSVKRLKRSKYGIPAVQKRNINRESRVARSQEPCSTKDIYARDNFP